MKISIIVLVFGIIFIISSFVMRESYEKEMYQLYISQQKENLVKGWNTSWQEFLVERYNRDSDKNAIYVTVNRNGKLLNNNFFPKHSLEEVNWSNYNSLDLKLKKDFLNSQLNKIGTWDRALAITKLTEIDPDFKFEDLSIYEKALIDSEVRQGLKLIFNQLKKNSDFSNLDSKNVFELVLMKAEINGEITLTVPSVDYLKNNLFVEYKKANNVDEIELNTDPFNIQIMPGFNPFKKISIGEKLIMGMGFLLLFAAVGIYLFELKARRLEVLKKVSFLNQLVHEVKTPVTGIKLHSELLIKHGHDEELVKSLLISANRLNEFFEDIVLINRNDKNLNLVEMNKYEFKDYLNEIISEFNHKIKLCFELDDDICFDKSRLRIVLRNLLKNAVRYGKNGVLKVCTDKQHVIFNIKDNGPGVPLEESQKIFSEFYRTKEAKNLSPDGLGIGLSIVKSMVSQMNGTIVLLNPGKENAEFELRINKNES